MILRDTTWFLLNAAIDRSTLEAISSTVAFRHLHSFVVF